MIYRLFLVAGLVFILGSGCISSSNNNLPKQPTTNLLEQPTVVSPTVIDTSISLESVSPPISESSSVTTPPIKSVVTYTYETEIIYGDSISQITTPHIDHVRLVKKGSDGSQVTVFEHIQDLNPAWEGKDVTFDVITTKARDNKIILDIGESGSPLKLVYFDISSKKMMDVTPLPSSPSTFYKFFPSPDGHWLGIMLFHDNTSDSYVPTQMIYLLDLDKNSLREWVALNADEQLYSETTGESYVWKNSTTFSFPVYKYFKDDPFAAMSFKENRTASVS